MLWLIYLRNIADLVDNHYIDHSRKRLHRLSIKGFKFSPENLSGESERADGDGIGW